MINEVVLEGIVVKTWKYAEDLLFRIACYRDPDLPSKSLNDVQDAADFVTIRVLKGNLGAPVVVEKGVPRAGARFSAEPGLRREPGGFPEGCPRRGAAGPRKPGSERAARPTRHHRGDRPAHHEPAQWIEKVTV